MRTIDRVERVSPSREIKGAGIVCMAAAWIVCTAAAGMLAAMPALAQDSKGMAQNGADLIGTTQNGSAATGAAQEERTGVSRPDSAVITVTPYSDDDAAPSSASTMETAHPVKPSAAVSTTTSAKTKDGTSLPHHAPVAAGHSTATSSGRTTAVFVKDSTAFDPDANIVTEETAGLADRRAASAKADMAAKENLDAGIVTRVSSRPGEVPDGTLVKVKLREELSTLTTRPGMSFTAEVSEPVLRDGQVVVPTGAVLEGRVTFVREGKRVGASAAIHLEPETITLPDGSQYALSARVIDTDSWGDTKVDSEGTILRKDHTKATQATIGISTGGAMAAGAVVGGVPGALVGAGLGAGVSTAVWIRQDRQADLPKDLCVIFSLTEPMRTTPLSARLTKPGVASTRGE